jgi:hypothetical protein
VPGARVHSLGGLTEDEHVPDIDGYGYKPGDRTVARLLDDMRTMSTTSLERIAAGWDKLAGEGEAHERFHEAERAALHAIEPLNMAPAWEDLRRQILDLTEGRVAMHDWKAEHGDVGHKAERAALGAALALTAMDHFGEERYRTLVAPMAESLPWLLG